MATTTTAQMIMNRVAQDVRQTLSAATLPDANTLLDYVDRVSFEILRASRWDFLISDELRFVTTLGVTDYWIGPAPVPATAPTSVDTLLHLPDVDYIQHEGVMDESNFHSLGQVTEIPLVAKLRYPDGSSRVGRPAVYRNNVSTPNILSIYPAPDNQNTYAPQPEPPVCLTTPGGALPNRFYFVTTTFVDSNGSESTAPLTQKIFIPAGNLLMVQPPVGLISSGTTGVQYNSYNVYASSNNSSPQGTALQTLSPLSTSLQFTEPGTGLLTATPNPPSSNNVEPVDGYVISFRYYKQQQPISATFNVLQVPDQFMDVVVAGVNAKAFSYLTRPQEAQQWYSMYREGITQIIRSRNWANRFSDYIGADGASIGGNLPAVEAIDLSVLQP